MFGRHRVKHRVGTQAGLKPFVAAALAIAVAGVGCASTRGTSIAQLLRQPITVEQHEVIATRYREQAAEAWTLAATHVTMAARYRASEGGSAFGPFGRRMGEHCRAVAAGYEDAVARYEALAATHASLARDWRTTPSRERRDDRKF
jgi:hypothetical protein